MTKMHQLQTRKPTLAASVTSGLLIFLRDAAAALTGAIWRHSTLRAAAAVAPERLIDCGIDPLLSRHQAASPEARIIQSLMSMR